MSLSLRAQMKTELSRIEQILFRLGAILTEPVLNTSVFATLYLWAAFLSQVGQPFGVPVLAGVIYALLLGFVVLFPLWTADSYVWFLAVRAQGSNAPGFRMYWFRRYRYQLARYASNQDPGGNFIKLLAQRLARARGEKLAPKKTPTLAVLLRTLGEEFNTIRYLKAGDSRKKEILAHIAKLDAELQAAETFVAGYLHHLVAMFLKLTDEERELMLGRQKISIWDKIESYPTASKIVSSLILGAVGIITFVLFGFPLFGLR